MLGRDFIKVFLKVIVQVLLFVTVCCIFVPFFPTMPREGLDPSWVIGVNQATQQGLTFGRDIIFTFGPYASIYTKSYHPATDHLMIAGGFYLAICYWIALFFLTNKSRELFVFCFVVALAGLMYSFDALLFSYPLLVSLYCFNSINSKENIYINNNVNIFLSVILFSAFGLLPLIKGSNLILCVIIDLLAFLIYFTNYKRSQAIAVVVSPVVLSIIFWVVSGQSLIDFPSYFASMIPIISGYSEAMAIQGINDNISYFLVVAMVILVAIYRENSIPLNLRVFIFAAFFIYFFLAFKGGFVRHDGHALIAGVSILIAALLFAFSFHSNWRYGVLLLSFFVYLSIDSHYVKTSTSSFFGNIKSTYFSAWHGVRNRYKNNTYFETDFINTLNQLNNKAKFPLLEGTTDIYSYNQSYLIASKNIWNPRPVFQSYSAYTADLILKNKNHLLSKNAPDNIIFQVETIDGRIPSIEDGASWPLILTHYQPISFVGNYLFLRKKILAPKVSELLLIRNASYSFGDVVPVLSDSTPIFVEISIKKNVYGKLMNILYKPSQLQITLYLENGVTKIYRIISGMAKSGFLLSPLIENTSEFGALYRGGDLLTNKKVKSFSIMPVSDKEQWERTYDVRFRKVLLPSLFDNKNLY